MLLEKLREEEHFTNHEKDVVRYILDHLEQVPSMSAGELARASFTSKATVVRLSQKLGLAGYQEFKLKLVEEVNQKNRIDRILANEPITGRARARIYQYASGALRQGNHQHPAFL